LSVYRHFSLSGSEFSPNIIHVVLACTSLGIAKQA
jgi:hypothetical protein